MKHRKVILFGGTFDPIHCGHITMAAYAMNYLQAEQLILIPAARSPHKSEIPSATGQQRVEMIRLSIQGQEQYQASDCELLRAQPSYTIDTVKEFRTQYGPTVSLYLLVGADAIPDLPRWHRIKELLDMCRLCILQRPGFDVSCLQVLRGQLSQAHIEQLGRDIIPTPLIDISSTQIRQKIALGQSVEGMLPPGVFEFIRVNRLYGWGNSRVS